MASYEEISDDLARRYPTIEACVLRCEALTILSKDELNARRYVDAADAAEQIVSILADRAIHERVLSLADSYHAAFTALGVAACLTGRPDQAAVALLQSIGTGTSPVLETFGPSMRLARELLTAGRADAVLEYLDECRLIWTHGSAVLDRWDEEIRDGRIPDFGANMMY